MKKLSEMSNESLDELRNESYKLIEDINNRMVVNTLEKIFSKWDEYKKSVIENKVINVIIINNEKIFIIDKSTIGGYKFTVGSNQYLCDNRFQYGFFVNEKEKYVQFTQKDIPFDVMKCVTNFLKDYEIR